MTAEKEKGLMTAHQAQGIHSSVERFYSILLLSVNHSLTGWSCALIELCLPDNSINDCMILTLQRGYN